ncbi:uncharacterized protein SAMN05421771_2833 [Granulicella pectinivorans]|jgi:uncharacterized protein|uniref:YecA family protein n=1 Tax=Granulicella pectinivorans TaxID=474950 RepID=A0A1I6MK31_9BACT|nr:YecA family protein [Granulicella pectinivorans]SFS16043.1 uncharacterized protein SAMN05421771_2833 [Granulicella pectinivorans]
MDKTLEGDGTAAGGVDLDALEELLESDATPETCMWLSELDGFLTGIAAGPERIPPAEFLPVIWGGEGPGFDGENSAPVVKSIVALLADIAAGLEKGPEAVLPVFWESEDGKEDATDWVEGFLQAIDLREEAWMPLLERKRDKAMLTPMLLLARDEEGNPLMPVEEGEEGPSEEQFADALEMIPECAVGIYGFWRLREMRVSPIVREMAPGRNDPCSCGSGKKYKKCCGG